MAASADLVVNIVTKLSGDGMQAAEKSTSKFRSGLASASKVAGGALAFVGAAAIHAASAAAEDAKAQALLANAMKNGAGASKSQIAATEDWISAQSAATGVADDELRPALATLVRATGDVEKSQRSLKTAMDISAATGKPLASVTAAMAKGFGGNTSALSRLVPGISQAALKSKDFARIMGEVAKKTKGAAGEAANTAAGQMQRFKLSLQETEESAGAVLLPVLTKLTGVLVTVGAWAQKHSTLFTIIAAGVAIMAVAIIALNTALSIYNTITAITAIVSASAWAATLGPILLVVAAVALVVGIIVILWKRSKTFRTIVMAVWRAIQGGARAMGRAIAAVWSGVASTAQRAGQIVSNVWARIRNGVANVIGWIRDHWRLLASILGGPFVAAAIVIASHWSQIREGASNVVGWIRSKFSGLAHVLTAPFDALVGAINAVISAVQSLIGWLSRIHVPSIKLPHIPGVNLAAAAPAPAVAGASAAPRVPTARASSSSVATGPTVIVYGAVDPEGTARAVNRILNGHSRRVGLRVS